MTETSDALRELREAIIASDPERAEAALHALAMKIASEGREPTEEELEAAFEAVRLIRFGSPSSASLKSAKGKGKKKSVADLLAEIGGDEDDLL